MYNFPHYTPQIPKSNIVSRKKFLKTNKQIGDYGERYVKCLLLDSGYFARKWRKKRFCGDLWAFKSLSSQKFNIEVKTAQENVSGSYCFCLKKEGHTDCCYSDFVILLLID